MSFWPVGTGYGKLRGAHNFYVFVRYLKKEGRFEAFLESADRVADEAKANMAMAQQRGLAEWAPWWNLPKDEENLERVRRQWQEFGPGWGA